MTIEYIDIYHCVKCGRMAYQLHDTTGPSCCNQPMFCAVKNAIREVPDGTGAQKPEPVDTLFADAMQETAAVR